VPMGDSALSYLGQLLGGMFKSKATTTASAVAASPAASAASGGACADGACAVP
jgi:hypothetical protein